MFLFADPLCGYPNQGPQALNWLHDPSLYVEVVSAFLCSLNTSIYVHFSVAFGRVETTKQVQIRHHALILLVSRVCAVASSK